MPTDWDTKAEPQIIVASSRKMLPLSRFFILSPGVIYHNRMKKARLQFAIADVIMKPSTLLEVNYGGNE
jgi:hypothetical protein